MPALQENPPLFFVPPGALGDHSRRDGPRRFAGVRQLGGVNCEVAAGRIVHKQSVTNTNWQANTERTLFNSSDVFATTRHKVDDGIDDTATSKLPRRVLPIIGKKSLWIEHFPRLFGQKRLVCWQVK